MPGSHIHPWRLREAARCFRRGGLIAYPTEAIYGLGCDPLNWSAVEALLQLKRRPIDKGLILIAASFEQLSPFVKPLPDAQMQPILESWPGPNTWLLPAADAVPYWLTGRHDTLAVRVTGHPIAAALSRACASPLVSSSANISNRRPARSACQAQARLGEQLDLIIGGPTGGQKNASVIRDAISGRVLRG
jgi:L-threonylcarbamoyladenylate synthase